MSTAMTRSDAEGALQMPGQDMRQFAQFLKRQQGQIAAVAANKLDAERVTRIVYGCVSRTPKLRECTMTSIVRSVLQAVELGLEPGSALGHAYLVPYNCRQPNGSFRYECQMITGYRGLADLMRRSGQVATISAHCVYAGDEFDYELGDNEHVFHRPGSETDPDRITHAYAIVKLKDGSIQRKVLRRHDIEVIRTRSRAGSSGPWVTDYPAMATKSALRQVAKLAPMSVELSKALAADEAADTGDQSVLAEFEAEVVEAEDVPETTSAPTATERIRARVSANSTRPPAQATGATTTALGPAVEPEPAREPIAPAVRGNGVWPGPGLCPGCHAPEGKPHATRCASQGGQVVEPRDDGAEEQDPFADGSEPVGTDGTVVLRPEAPAYDPKQVATLFASYAAQLGVLKRTALPGEIKALRDQLLPELVAGSVWRDVTEEQYHTLITRLQERAA